MKRQKTPNLVTMAVLTAITVIFWVGFEVFFALTSEPDLEIPPEILMQLDPTLDAGALNKLQNRIYLTEEEIGEGIEITGEEVVITTATVGASPTPVATTEGEFEINE